MFFRVMYNNEIVGILQRLELASNHSERLAMDINELRG